MSLSRKLGGIVSLVLVVSLMMGCQQSSKMPRGLKPVKQQVLSQASTSAIWRGEDWKRNAIPVLQHYQGPKGTYVDWGECAVSDFDQMITTDQVAVCLALAVIDPVSEKQMLCHVFPSISSRRIRKALERSAYQGINIQRSHIYVMPGLGGGRSHDKARGAVYEALNAMDPSLPGRVHFLKKADDNLQGISLYQGHFYIESEQEQIARHSQGAL